MERIPTLPYGVARHAALLQAGVSRHQLQRLVAQGLLSRIHRGWYATADADPNIRGAIARGGRLSCLSALARHGLWKPPEPGVHVRLLEHARTGRQTARLPSGVHRCRASGPHALLDFGPVDPLDIALMAAGRCTTPEYFVAIMDSLLRKGSHSVDDLEHMLRHCPQTVRRLVGHTDLADSGTESLVRFRLRSLGIRVRPQVVVPDVGRVDLLVGNRLVLEIDSRAHHDDPDAYARDRERDLALARLDYDRLRLTYQHVMYRWDEALPGIMTIVRRGDHLRARRPRG